MKYLLLLVAACGRYGFADLTDAAGSGSASTRLRQEYFVYDGTLRQPTDLYDTLLAASCTPTDTVAGTRCLPAGGYVYYADAACTQPIAQPATSDPRFAFPDSYGPVANAYSIGASVGTPAMVYVTQFSGVCQGQTPPAGEFFSLTDIGFAMFASLTPTFGSEGRLVSQTLVADDGFRTSGALHDTVANGDCFGAKFDDGDACFVYPTDLSEYYNDSGCTHHVESAIVPVKFAEDWPLGSTCNTTDVHMRAVTGELPRTTPIWVDIPGSGLCAQTGLPAGWKLFDLGAEFPLASLMRAPVPGGRMQLIASTANGARGIDPSYVWDSQLSIECRPQIAADGVLRCLPNAPYGNAAGYFTDAGCTQPITGAGVATPQCTSQPVTLLRDAAGSNTRVFQASPHAGQIYGGTPASCQPYQNQVFYAEGAEVPAAMFAAVTQQTDP